MAKSKAQQQSDEHAQVVKDEATAEKAYQKTLDERVGEVYDQPEPVEVVVPPMTEEAEPPVPLTPEAQWLKDAGEAQAVFAGGNVVSPDTLKALIARAIGLLTPKD